MKKLWILILPLLAYACTPNNDFKTSNGVSVSMLEKGDGATAVKDSIVLMYMMIKTEDGDTLTQATADRPLAIAYDPEMEAGDLQEVLTYLEQGDSVAFSVTAKNLFEETYQSQVPPDMDSTAMVNINLKFADQMSQESYRAYQTELRNKQQAKASAILEEKLISDGDSIDAYLEKEGIDAITTESGLRYVITEEGTGATAEPGDQVTVHYDGKLLSGERFDSSLERGDPFEFPIGQGRVIPGWDEGIGYIKAGGKGTLYIPSPLGYGSRAAGEVIKPYSILVFDVEVLGVDKSESEPVQ